MQKNNRMFQHTSTANLYLKVKKILNVFFFNWLDIVMFYRLQYEGVPPEVNARSSATIREAFLEDIAEMEKLALRPYTFRERFTNGDRAVAALFDGKIVGFEWFCTSSSHIETVTKFVVAVPGDAIYAYDAFILPNFRLSGIWGKFQSKLRDIMLETSKNRIITLIDIDNKMSIATHLRYGYEITNEIMSFRVGGLRCHFEMKRKSSR